MKLRLQIFSLVFVFVIIVCICFFGSVGKEEVKSDYLRLHIRANSNSVEDQNIKYEVKNEVVKLLTPLIVDIKSKEELEKVLVDNEMLVENVVDQFLKERGFYYGCDMKIHNEFFPTRTYENVTLEADYYDALIINLGSGAGNNWWCVVYPPLCFVGNDVNEQNVVYKSKLLEIIDKFF